jgi:glycosyltransferase 2 family protein
MANKDKDLKTKLIINLKSTYFVLKRIFTNPAVQTIVIIFTLAFAIYYFVNQYDSIKSQLLEIDFSTQYLLWALLLTILATFLGCIRWWALLSWLGEKRNWIEVSKYYALTTLSKYIPGFIWQYASRAFYMENLSIPIKTIGTAIAAEFLLITSIGGILSSLTFLIIPVGFKTQNLVIIAMIILLLLTIFIIFFPKIISKIYCLFQKKELAFQPKFYWVSILLILIGWLVMSCVYWFILNSQNAHNLSLLTAIYFNSTSFTIGNLVIPIPNGLIIRETILINLGRDSFNEISMVLSSTTFRLLILLAESIVALLFFAISLIFQKKITPSIEN